MARIALIGTALALGCAAVLAFAARQPDRSSVAGAPARSAAAERAHPAEFSIPDSLRIDFISRINGRAYEIQVALPHGPAPPAGYSVIYLFDGNAYFGSVTEAVRDNGNAPQAIVVGLGYPEKGGRIPERLDGRDYDLSLPLSEATFRAMSPLERRPEDTPKSFGGVDEFLRTIETEVKPRVYALAKVNRKDQALFGHSFGGLAVLDALFTEPEAFRTFIAASPSIWWGDREVLGKEAAFEAKVTSKAVAPRILITVGAEEASVQRVLPPELAGRRAEVEVLMKKDRMVANACELANRLKALPGAPGYEGADCAVFVDQGHGISVWPAIGRAVEYAFAP